MGIDVSFEAVEVANLSDNDLYNDEELDTLEADESKIEVDAETSEGEETQEDGSDSEEVQSEEPQEEQEIDYKSVIYQLQSQVQDLQSQVEKSSKNLQNNNRQLRKHRQNFEQLERSLVLKKEDLDKRIEEAELNGDTRALIRAEQESRELQQEAQELDGMKYLQQVQDRYDPVIERMNYPELQQDMVDFLVASGKSQEDARTIVSNPYYYLSGDSYVILANSARMLRAALLNGTQKAEPGKSNSTSKKRAPSVTKAAKKASSKSDPFNGVTAAPKKGNRLDLMSMKEITALSDAELDALIKEDNRRS